MEFFQNAQFVRLQSRIRRRKYLFADEDGRGISLDGRRALQNTAWAVQFINIDGEYILLRGVYGRYLAATDLPAPRGHSGFNAIQDVFDQPEVDAIMWKPVRRENDVVLRNVSGRYLRTNGKFRRWHKAVTVDVYDNICRAMQWEVQVIPLRPARPPLPPPARRGRFSVRQPPEVLPRQIRYVRADADGNINDAAWTTIQYENRSVMLLRSELAHRMANAFFFFRTILCARAGRYGQLTPLYINLPRSNDPMDIVVVSMGTRADNDLRYPDVDAPMQRRGR